MSIEAGDFKTGLTLLIDGNIYQVLDFQHVKPGKGAAILRTKLKDLRNGGVQERTFNPNIKFEPALIIKQEAQFSYVDNGTFYFMDMETYETYEVREENIGFQKNFLVEGASVNIKLYETEILGVEIPEKIALKITETTEPAKGGPNDTKDATLETGFVVKVPMFIKQGEEILVNTNDGKYAGRA